MNSFPYDAVVFDLDGTLFDSKDCIIAAVTQAMKEAGLEVPADANLDLFVGPPFKDTFPTLLKIPENRAEEVIAIQRRIFYEKAMYDYPLYPGIRKILRTLHDGGVHVALATSKTLKMGLALLRMAHLDGYFDAIIGENETDEKLGKPEMIRRAIPEGSKRPVMVGDRCFDRDGARANGIDFIAAGYGYGTRQELESGCIAFAEDTSALYTLLCGNAPVAPGFFLSVEGLDGSGKSTQIQLLAEKLHQFDFDLLMTREPGGCSISEKIRTIILDRENAAMCPTCEALLYAASRAQHVHELIEPALAQGRFVLSDRFVDSSVAYQGGARELGISRVEQINEPAVRGCMPDASVYLSIDAEQALKRRYAASVPDRLEMESLQFHKKVQAAYEELIGKHPERFIVVDADRPPRQVAAEVLEKVLDRAAPHGRRWEC